MGIKITTEVKAVSHAFEYHGLQITFTNCEKVEQVRGLLMVSRDGRFICNVRKEKSPALFKELHDSFIGEEGAENAQS
jgi:hypothetical protein